MPAGRARFESFHARHGACIVYEMQEMGGRGHSRLAIAGLAAALLAAGCGSSRADREARAALQQRLAGAPPQDLGPRADLLWKSARRFYEGRGYSYVWLDGASPDGRAESLQKAVRDTVVDGLDPAEYDFKPLEPLQARSRSWIPLKKGAVPAARRAEAEVRFTASFLKLASELLVGRVDPARVDPHWFGQYRLVAPERMLEHAAETGRVQATLNGLVPHHPQ